jgi:hypothetical protein
LSEEALRKDKQPNIFIHLLRVFNQEANADLREDNASKRPEFLFLHWCSGQKQSFSTRRQIQVFECCTAMLYSQRSRGHRGSQMMRSHLKMHLVDALNVAGF